MKKVYLVLAIIGFALPNYFVFWESVETGNILLYTHISATLAGMFANRISSIFMIDLLIVVFIFIIWTYQESKSFGIKGIGWLWFATFLLGLSGGFPMFLYLREKKLNESSSSSSD
ncbi:MAG TPA: hypothetical protein DCE41_37040 [Cytophagales bacterium]|nr:hypothetical protein [Cytophagales bacterium]HAA21178.1 hypothetical protein [Cytophagales bacterium]HAP60698.1 hypothetical protein [Cytophagales bacterium]